jgi:hypothetical protein
MQKNESMFQQAFIFLLKILLICAKAKKEKEK